MIKRGLVAAMLAFTPLLASCTLFRSESSSTSSTTKPSVLSNAREQLLVAEFSFQAALRSIQVEVKAGRLKGQKARDTEKAIVAAKAALDIARAAVSSGSVTDPAVLVAAISQVSNLIQTFQLK